MFAEDRTWYKLEGAAPEAIRKLQTRLGDLAPVEYFDLLAFSNGGEGPLDIQPLNFCLDSAETVASYLESQRSDDEFLDFVVFGGNGGGELIAFDTRSEGSWGIVRIDSTNINLSESVVPIASDFAAFLHHVGIEGDDS